MVEGSSCRAFPEVLVAQRATLRAFLVVLMGRVSRAPNFPKNFFFVPTPFFAGSFFFFLLFLSIHFPVLVAFTVFLVPRDTRYTHPPYCAHLLPLSHPTVSPHPCLLLPSLTPPKPCPARLNSLCCPSRRHASEESSPPTRPPTAVRRGTGGPLPP